MPRKPPPKQITAWSFSRWNTYNTCPRKAKYEYIDKLETTTSEAMQRGKDIHNLAEAYVKGVITKLPHELSLFDEEFEQLAALKKKKTAIAVETELQLAFNADWVPCKWFAQTARTRVVFDCIVLNQPERRATIIDYKTGKIKDDYAQQLELYAAASFAMYPWLKTVRPELWYLDHGELKEDEYDSDQADDLIATWNNRAQPMLVDKRFAPKPSYLCQWCDFSQAKGGPCEY